MVNNKGIIIQILKCQSDGIRRPGRPRKNWREDIVAELREWGLEYDLWRDRERWITQNVRERYNDDNNEFIKG